MDARKRMDMAAAALAGMARAFATLGPGLVITEETHARLKAASDEYEAASKLFYAEFDAREAVR